MKVGIFGVWHVHANDYTKTALELGEVLGFYERDDALAEEFAKEFNIHRFATEEELLSSEAEGIIICSATCDHAADMIKTANAKKSIFSEKVLALTDEECNAIERAVNENGVNLTISLVQKYYGAHIAVKNVVDSGELGKVNYLRFRNCHSGSTKNWLPVHFYNREQCGGGAMIDLGAHGMYLINWLLGMPVSASSQFTLCCANKDAAVKNVDGVEDNAVTVMSFADGAIAVNETGFASNITPRLLEVCGEDGYIRYEYGKIQKCTVATRGRIVEVPTCDDLPSPIEQFLTGKPLPGCSIKEAKALTHMMVMAYSK